MSIEIPGQHRAPRIIVIGNEKGGSGKSTVAMHVAVGLLKLGHEVATIDLDSRQKSLTRYIENRGVWANRASRHLDSPDHFCIELATAADRTKTACEALADAVDRLMQSHNFIVIDTPGHDGELSRLAHSIADTLITPINDSFVDFDVLGLVDPETFAVSGLSHYSEMVEETRRQRLSRDLVAVDWVVLRNRLSMLSTRNKRLVGTAIEGLADRLGFRFLEGLAERMIFREFFPRGLTALDELSEATLGTRPTLSHATARQEVTSLIGALGILPAAVLPHASPGCATRDAA
jgi:chromosome partitioning protein